MAARARQYATGCGPQRAGHSHALQIDADGQHDLDDAARLLRASQAAPDHLIGGLPVFGDDAPRARLYGRWLTRIWVWINTLSFDIPDAMCGLRVYPLQHVIPVLAHTGTHMDFDIEILVRLHWARVPMHWIPPASVIPSMAFHTSAHWPTICSSAACMPGCFGMLARSPQLLARNWKESGK